MNMEVEPTEESGEYLASSSSMNKLVTYVGNLVDLKKSNIINFVTK